MTFEQDFVFEPVKIFCVFFQPAYTYVIYIAGRAEVFRTHQRSSLRSMYGH